MTGVLYAVSQATLVATVPLTVFLTVKTLATASETVQTRYLHQQHHITMTGHTPNPIMITTIGTDPSPLTTDAAKEDTLTSQDHTANPATAEVPATIRDIHPTPHLTTIAGHDTHQLTNAVGDTLTETHHPSITMTHLRHTTFPTGVTLKATLWAKADLT